MLLLLCRVCVVCNVDAACIIFVSIALIELFPIIREVTGLEPFNS